MSQTFAPAHGSVHAGPRLDRLPLGRPAVAVHQSGRDRHGLRQSRGDPDSGIETRQRSLEDLASTLGETGTERIGGINPVTREI